MDVRANCETHVSSDSYALRSLDGVIETAPVLVAFRKAVSGKSELQLTRRDPVSVSPLLVGAMRRCVPYSQIEAALKLCHRGHEEDSSTWQRCVRVFDGIPRELCREYVQRCEVCGS